MLRLPRRPRPGVSRCPRSGDLGFTLVELLISMVIIFIVVTALLTVYVGSLTTTVQAKQRQAGSALATQNLERVRALPYDVLVAGNRVADLAGDPYVSTSGVPRVTLEGRAQDLVTSTTQNIAPLFPHRNTVQQDGVRYTVSVYVAKGSTTNTSYDLLSVVDWTTAGSGGAKQVVQRSVAYSATGCLSTANRPFSGPCQAAFSANSGITAGQVTVTNLSDSTQPVPGTSGTRVGLDLPGLAATTAIEQTVTVSSTARSMGAKAVSSAESTSGGVAASSAADTDPSSVGSTSASGTTPAQTTTPVSIAGSAGTFRATPSSGDAGRVSSEVVATSTGCEWTNAVAVASGQPCASGRSASPGTATITHELPALLASPVVVPIASMTPGSTASRAAAGRLTNSVNGLCPGTSGDGCAVAAASRTVDTVQVGGLPARTRVGDVLPSGFDAIGSAVQVSGLVETARAESGPGGRAAEYTRAGTLAYWNGTSFVPVNLAGLNASQDHVFDPPPVTGTYTSGTGRTFLVTADATVRVTKREVTPACTAAGGPCSGSAKTASAISAQVEYTVIERVTGFVDVERTRYVVLADLGAVNANTYYRAAPSA